VPVANEMFVLQRITRGNAVTLLLERITMDDCILTHWVWRHKHTLEKTSSQKYQSHVPCKSRLICCSVWGFWFPEDMSMSPGCLKGRMRRWRKCCWVKYGFMVTH